MEQSPSWEVNRFSASQEIPRISWNPKVHYRIHECPTPVPILSHYVRTSQLISRTNHFLGNVCLLSFHVSLQHGTHFTIMISPDTRDTIKIKTYMTSDSVRMVCISVYLWWVCLFSWRYNPSWLYIHSPVAGFSLLVFEVSWSHTTRQSVGLLWTSDQSVADTST
jgi:hypothetical protein